jgi:CDP-diacylglycerol--glycerol-3-phosphate 3-phosphatidyltransferase
VARTPLTARRLLGLDRSGGLPQAARKGEPLRPWTLPNVVGYVRLALIPVFLVLGLQSGDGRAPAAAVLYGFIGASDYLDGLLARITGQYSRLGAILDPVADRLLVLCGAVVAWNFELLPRWALAALATRELFTLALSELALRRGLDLNIKMIGRWAVWPTMFSIFLSMLSDTPIADGLLILGLVLSIVATLLYMRDGFRFERERRRPSTSA